MEATGQASLGLASVRRLCGEPIKYEDLADRIAGCSFLSLSTGNVTKAATTDA
ncbi:hypothetical protein [Streptomyces sp. Y1]|uniref:Uncharacterized protein n=1 Tax=Streptomyces sp. Y1 TaxID=3238634 RepID=A0AB39TUR1_9ACTN